MISTLAIAAGLLTGIAAAARVAYLIVRGRGAPALALVVGAGAGTIVGVFVAALIRAMAG